MENRYCQSRLLSLLEVMKLCQPQTKEQKSIQRLKTKQAFLKIESVQFLKTNFDQSNLLSYHKYDFNRDTTSRSTLKS